MPVSVDPVRPGYRWGMTGRRRRSSALLVAGVLALAGCGTEPPAATPTLEEPTIEVRAAPSETPEPLVTTAPDEYSKVGELVAGFPIELLPVPNDAVILVTSAVPVGTADVREISLNLRTSATAAELITLYRSALTAAGFTELDTEGNTALVADVTFTRSGGDEVISIGIHDVDGARTVTIGGRVRTEG